ncbi:hypothetical protein EUGRSUZ_J01494 [Eucalyptus grandis]|uniref:Uncharacterized protein n=2 Tax=Eucalyptus grandis TaxID=71139 RepID=A0ACC3J5G8_EUCGR|nr:hypothetical protein EUGRSUZ_J01494 [Eucalyptus grandis]
MMLSYIRRTFEETQNEFVDYAVKCMMGVVRPSIINTYQKYAQGQHEVLVKTIQPQTKAGTTTSKCVPPSTGT